MLSQKKVIPGQKKLSLPLLENPVTVRIRFCKKGNLQFISHLDLQRTFHRVLVRANIPMWYTKGFNPHAKLVFGLPLSIGTESICEMADLKIERKIDLVDIKNQMNRQLTDEMYVLDAYYPVSKFSDIAFANYTITLRSSAITGNECDMLKKMFSSPIVMNKRSKSGEKEVDITTFIKSIDFKCENGCLVIGTILSAGGAENLNPEYIVNAIKMTDMFDNISSDLCYSIIRNRVYDKYLIEFR